MTWRVAVPSYRRAQTVGRRTLPLLLGRGVPAAAVTVYCVPDEAAEYAYVARVFGVTLDAHAPLGMAAVRNYIARQHAAGTRILFADDDLSDLCERVDSKTLRPVADIAELADQGFGLAGAGLWGVYPVLNPYFMKPRVNRKLTHVVGCFYGMTVSGTDTDLVSMNEKEDFERTIKHYLRDGAVTRLEWVAPKTRYYAELGGMQAQADRHGTSEHACTELLRRYPNLCQRSTRRKEYAQVVLRDRRVSA